MRAALTLALLALPLAALAADGVVLIYRGANKWVAPADNKPLQTLLKAAEDGQERFEVRVPEAGRELATGRLEVLRDLLAAKARKGVLLEEVAGPAAAPNTLWVK